jgi:hypothetical protein
MPQLQSLATEYSILLVELAKAKNDIALQSDTIKTQDAKLKRQTQSIMGKDLASFNPAIDADSEGQVRKRKRAQGNDGQTMPTGTIQEL